MAAQMLALIQGKQQHYTAYSKGKELASLGNSVELGQVHVVH